MANYVCRKCKHPVPIEKATEVFKYGEKAKKTLVVNCPHCGTQNTFEVPKQ